jgi:hypothetical protein
MKLTDLDPKWLCVNGHRIGFTFVSPTNPKWRQSCFAVSGISIDEQLDLFGDYNTQGCNSECAWTIEGGINNADFDSITVTPSLDGSAGGLWHGLITNGEIVGGLPS